MKLLLSFLLTTALLGGSLAYSDSDLSEADLIDIILEYRIKYHDQSVSIDDLTDYFVNGIRLRHEESKINGNRFSDLSVEWSLNAAVQFEEVEKIYEAKCFPLENIERCIHLEGRDLIGSENKVSKVIIGFLAENNDMKIGAVHVKHDKGAFEYNVTYLEPQ